MHGVRQGEGPSEDAAPDTRPPKCCKGLSDREGVGVTAGALSPGRSPRHSRLVARSSQRAVTTTAPKARHQVQNAWTRAVTWRPVRPASVCRAAWKSEGRGPPRSENEVDADRTWRSPRPGARESPSSF